MPFSSLEEEVAFWDRIAYQIYGIQQFTAPWQPGPQFQTEPLETPADVLKQTVLRLMTAAELGKADEVSCILESCDPAVRKLVVEGTAEKAGYTALHQAAWHGFVDVAAVLLKHGANVNARDSQTGDTALHQAAFTGNLDFIRFLLKHGADVKAVNRTRMMVPLHRAPGKLDSAEVIDTLVKAGSDVMATDRRGETVLHLAIKACRVNQVKRLVELAPQLVSVKTNRGETAVQLASEANLFDIVDFLQQFGDTFDVPPVV